MINIIEYYCSKCKRVTDYMETVGKGWLIGGNMPAKCDNCKEGDKD